MIISNQSASEQSSFDQDAYRQSSTVITKPGSEYGVDTRAFQGIPSLACGREGRIWAVWYGGITPGEDRNNYAILALSEDSGSTWSGEILVIVPDIEGQVRAFDPQIWLDPDGRLWFFWAQGVDKPSKLGPSGVWAVTAREADGADAKWSAPRRLGDGVMMCKPLILSDGGWALPVSFWDRREKGSAAMVVSRDRGLTWREQGACDVPPAVRDHDEHMLVELQDGALWMLVRTKYGIGESVSRDGGITWTALQPAAIPHVRSRFFIRRLHSGNLLLVRHDPVDGALADLTNKGRRSHLTAFLSADDGRTWPWQLLLDDRDQVSYPDGDQAEDGVIHLIYDFQRVQARSIIAVSFTEQMIKQGHGEAALPGRSIVSQPSGGS